MLLPLISARLVLRRFGVGDAAAFAAYRADPDVARYQGWDGCSLDEALTFIRRQRRQPPGRAGRWTQIALVVRDGDALAGDCGLLIHADGRQATIGITLARPYQGRGLATEALTLLLDHLFGSMAVHRVQAEVDPRNHRSWVLLERLGMRREGHQRQSTWFKGEWADEYLYAVLRQEWLAQHPHAGTG